MWTASSCPAFTDSDPTSTHAGLQQQVSEREEQSHLLREEKEGLESRVSNLLGDSSQQVTLLNQQLDEKERYGQWLHSLHH